MKNNVTNSSFAQDVDVPTGTGTRMSSINAMYDDEAAWQSEVVGDDVKGEPLKIHSALANYRSGDIPEIHSEEDAKNAVSEALESETRWASDLRSATKSAELFTAASEWFEKNGKIREAIDAHCNAMYATSRVTLTKIFSNVIKEEILAYKKLITLWENFAKIEPEAAKEANEKINECRENINLFK
ncbi:MAG: hypothetical protein LBB18_00880 [Puniceicoccales bacterium]|nr:hypothetical protein [Puniceicoccales bacterium]